MKTRTTKHSLFMSAIALLLCCSMLIGTTFAWFTDSVTSANNIIKSGTLDVTMHWADGSEAIPADDSADWKDASTSKIFNYDKWEPGYTEVKHIKIANKGTLALKYMVTITAYDSFGAPVAPENVSILSKAIDVYYIDPAQQITERTDMSTLTKLGTLYDVLGNFDKTAQGVLKEGEKDVVTLALKMQEDAGNEYQNLSIGNTFAVTLFATQLNSEIDSFDKDYDIDAEYPESNSVYIAKGNGGQVDNGNVTVVIPTTDENTEGTYTLNVIPKGTTEENGETTVAYDIVLEHNGATAPNVTYTVKINIGAGKDVAKVTHNGADVSSYSYDPITGDVTFTTNSFSPFTVTFTDADDETVYLPEDPEAAEKLEEETVVAVDENGNSYTTLTAAVNSGASKLYMKEDADLGTITHLNVTDDLVIFGNGAYISGGEKDFAIDMYAKLEKDITISVYNLHGAAFWGSRSTEHTVNINMYNCNDISRIYLGGTTGVNNINMYNCTATADSIVGDTGVYSNANGKIVIDGCTFTNVGCPVNLNHKVAGTQTVVVTNTAFVDCSTTGTAAYYAPIRLYNSVDGAEQVLTANGNTFTYSEGKAPINKADILLNAKHDGVDATGTVKAEVQMDANVAKGANVDLTYTISNETELFALAGAVNKYSNYERPFEGDTVKLMNSIDLGGKEWTPIGDYRFSATRFCGTFDGQGNTISNFQITKKTSKNDSNKSSYGFFGNMEGTVKNLIIDNATICSYAYVGALVGRMTNGTLIDCEVKNSTVESTYWQAGGMIGQLNDNCIVKGCKVTNTDVTGASAIGGLAGPITATNSDDGTIKTLLFEDCSVIDTDIIQKGSFGANYDSKFGTYFAYLESEDNDVDINNCKAVNTTIKGVADTTLSYDIEGSDICIDGAKVVKSSDELKAAITSGTDAVLVSDIEMTGSISISNADFVLDGNGHTVTMTENATNPHALFDINGGKATIKNIIFDGIKDGAVVRTVDVDFTADNVTAKNGNHTQVQGIFRLLGKNTITNCTFDNNICNMAVTLNFDTNSSDYPQVIKNCVFSANTCNDTAVAYYVYGSGFTLDGNKFIGNKVYSAGNAATVYLGFKANCVVTNNIFENNAVTTTHATTKRAAGALMVGNAATITNNSFVGNTVTGANAKGNDVCASVYYSDIDLSGNYWGGSAPVENDDYFVEYPDNNSVIINDYLTTYVQ